MDQRVDRVRNLRDIFAGLRAELRRLISPPHPEERQSDVKQVADEIARALLEHTPTALEQLQRYRKEAAQPEELRDLKLCLDEFEAGEESDAETPFRESSLELC